MQQLPLFSIELQGVTAGFRDAARELGGTRRLVTDAGVEGVGDPVCDPAIETALADLAAILGRLERTAAECVGALNRYDERGPA